MRRLGWKVPFDTEGEEDPANAVTGGIWGQSDHGREKGLGVWGGEGRGGKVRKEIG